MPKGVCVPTLQDLVHIYQKIYGKTAFLQMEQHALAIIQQILGPPTAGGWLRFYCCGTYYEESHKVQNFARDFINFHPSAITLTALILVRYIRQQPRRMYDESEGLMQIAELLDKCLATIGDLSEILVPLLLKASTTIVQ